LVTEEAGGQNSGSNWSRSRQEKRSVRHQKWEERTKRSSSANAHAHCAGEDDDYEYEYEYEYCDEDPEHSHPVKERATQRTCPFYLSFIFKLLNNWKIKKHKTININMCYLIRFIWICWHCWRDCKQKNRK
jgi:hypothetical protein